MRMAVIRSGWLQDPTSVAPGARAPEEPDVRQRKEKAFDRLLRTPYADDVVHVLQHYVRDCIPRYRATEREYWSLSCMPGTLRGRLAAVSLRSMETFVVHGARLVDGGRTMQKHGHCNQLADLVVGDAAPSCAHQT